MEDGEKTLQVVAKPGLDRELSVEQSQKFDFYSSAPIYMQFLSNFNIKQRFGGVLALILFIVFLLIEIDPQFPRANEALAGTCVVAIFWIFEVLPVPMTSVLPLILFPLIGVNTSKEVARNYYNDITFLFIGAFLIVIAAEEKKAHKRFAINLLMRFGSRPRSILLGFMTVSGVLSMFASNTSTTIMLVPIVQGLLDGKDDPDSVRFTKVSKE